MRNRHIVITGDAVDELGGAAEALRHDGSIVTVGSAAARDTLSPVTSFIIVARFTTGMEWDAWWAQDAHNQAEFEAVLPQLSSASNGMLIGLSSTMSRSGRAEIRSGMHSLLHRFHAHAAARRGVDFSMNGIEIPDRFDRDLLIRRLQQHANRRGLLANEAVIRFEDLNHHTIAQAMTTDII